MEQSIEKITNPAPLKIEMRYGERLSSLDEIKPPKNEVTKIETYPIGSTNAVGSSVISAAAVLAKRSASPIPTEIRIPKNELFNAVSSVPSIFAGLFLL